MAASDTFIILSSGNGAFRVSTKAENLNRFTNGTSGDGIWKITSVIVQTDGTSTWDGAGRIDLSTSYVCSSFDSDTSKYVHSIKRPVRTTSGPSGVTTLALFSSSVDVGMSTGGTTTGEAVVVTNDMGGTRGTRNTKDFIRINLPSRSNVVAFPLTVEFLVTVPPNAECVSAFVNYLGSSFNYQPAGGTFGEIGGAIVPVINSVPRCKIVAGRKFAGKVIGTLCLYMSDFGPIRMPTKSRQATLGVGVEGKPLMPNGDRISQDQSVVDEYHAELNKGQTITGSTRLPWGSGGTFSVIGTSATSAGLGIIGGLESAVSAVQIVRPYRLRNEVAGAGDVMFVKTNLNGPTTNFSDIIAYLNSGGRTIFRVGSKNVVTTSSGTTVSNGSSGGTNITGISSSWTVKRYDFTDAGNTSHLYKYENGPIVVIEKGIAAPTISPSNFSDVATDIWGLAPLFENWELYGTAPILAYTPSTGQSTAVELGRFDFTGAIVSSTSQFGITGFTAGDDTDAGPMELEAPLEETVEETATDKRDEAGTIIGSFCDLAYRKVVSLLQPPPPTVPEVNGKTVVFVNFVADSIQGKNAIINYRTGQANETDMIADLRSKTDAYGTALQGAGSGILNLQNLRSNLALLLQALDRPDSDYNVPQYVADPLTPSDTGNLLAQVQTIRTKIGNISDGIEAIVDAVTSPGVGQTIAAIIGPVTGASANQLRAYLADINAALTADVGPSSVTVHAALQTLAGNPGQNFFDPTGADSYYSKLNLALTNLRAASSSFPTAYAALIVARSAAELSLLENGSLLSSTTAATKKFALYCRGRISAISTVMELIVMTTKVSSSLLTTSEASAYNDALAEYKNLRSIITSIPISPSTSPAPTSASYVAAPDLTDIISGLEDLSLSVIPCPSKWYLVTSRFSNAAGVFVNEFVFAPFCVTPV